MKTCVILVGNPSAKTIHSAYTTYIYISPETQGVCEARDLFNIALSNSSRIFLDLPDMEHFENYHKSASDTGYSIINYIYEA